MGYYSENHYITEYFLENLMEKQLLVPLLAVATDGRPASQSQGPPWQAQINMCRLFWGDFVPGFTFCLHTFSFLFYFKFVRSYCILYTNIK